MPIVFAFAGSVKQYLEQFERLFQLDNCPFCAAKDQMVRHGVYWRKPRDTEQVFHLPIQRWRCKACRRTVAALPDFLLGQRWYVLGVIQAVLGLRFEQGAAWRELDGVGETAPHQRTKRRWCAGFSGQALRWLGAVQTTLAEQDSASPWLNPQGEALRAGDPPRALLAASLHLLAWAKSRWRELAPYGHNERLKFLWLWGCGRGIGRLV